MPTGSDTDFNETNCTRVVDNFDIFPATICTPSSNKRYRSKDLWKWREFAGNSSYWTDLQELTNSAFRPSSQRKLRKIKTQKL
jgi:hypothetical protein